MFISYIIYHYLYTMSKLKNLGREIGRARFSRLDSRKSALPPALAAGDPFTYLSLYIYTYVHIYIYIYIYIFVADTPPTDHP